TTPYTVTWGDTFSVLPFGNTLFLMDLTGAQIQDLLDQSGKLYKGILQSAGVSYYWYNDEAAAGNRAPTAWGAYGVMVGDEPLERDKVYRVVTNNFLAGGQDGWVTFADGTNRWDTYYDMQLGLNEYIEEVLGGTITAESVKMQRIRQLDKVVTILHTNDIHGNFLASSYYGDPNGMVYLGALIDKERAHNPNALLLDAGDTFQGNSFAYFFKDATPNPIAGTLNMLDYDAIVLGNHEFNFGPQTLATAFGQLNFPILGNANLDDDGSYGFINANVKDYITKTVDGLDVAIFGLTNPRVPRYELPTNIPGLTFHPATETVKSLVPAILDAEDPDLLIGLTHIGYSPYGDEKDSDVLVAQETSGIDVLVGAHSHTRLDPAVMITSTVNPTGTLVAQAYKYATYLGKVNIGFVGGEVVLREGYLIPATETMTHTALSEYLQPFSAQLDTFNDTEIGQTLVPLDALEAYTEETNGANLQVDASAWELEQHGVMVDFHLSGAMSNKRVADTASASNPVTLTKGDMFDLMPYENSLVALEMTGAQIKEILERSYRNYYNYKYVPGHGGYSYYTTCFLDINQGGEITYIESVPNGNNVYSLSMNGQEIDLTDDTVTYTVSTVNYVAAGSCNFNNDGETIWPLDQIVADTQLYVRDAVINYVDAQAAPIAPAVEDRLVFADSDLSTSTKTVVDASGNDIAEAGEVLTYTITLVNTGMNGAAVMLTDTLPTGVDYVTGSLSYGGLPADATVAMLDDVLTVRTQNFPDQPIGASFTINVPATIEFAVTVSDPVPEGETIENTIELRDQTLTYEIAPAVISLPTAGYKIFLPIIMRELTN
ncbi:MAG: 5'-nucleotidase C-terminal domain-containing protein, partial [Anaerolineae bacterium]|nr:5'-nucleotidase C-terminal domain-containing protein [Anaerolineae bacterium]